MRKTDLDFIRRPRPLRVAGVMLLLLSLLGLATLIVEYRQRTAELAALDAQLHRSMQLQRKAAAAVAVDNRSSKQLALELLLAQRVIDQLAMPWDTLFQTLETTLGDDVSLLGVVPDAEKMTLTINAEARTLAAMVAYQTRLADEALFQDVYISSHQTQQQDQQKPVRFLVSARWSTGVAPLTGQAETLQQAAP